MSGEKLKILIIEKDSIVAKDIEAIAKKNGYKVVGVCLSSENALDLYKKTTPDLLIIDANIKGGLKAKGLTDLFDKKSNDVAVLYLTTGKDWVDKNEVFKSFPAPHLQQPFTENQLLNR